MIPRPIRIALGVGALPVFTVVASEVFMRWSRLIKCVECDFGPPLYQWWTYLLNYPSDPQVRMYLIGSGAAGLLVCVIILGATVSAFREPFSWRRDLRWSVRKEPQPDRLPMPAIMGPTDNHGHARWATEEEMRERWGSTSEYGALAVGELYNPLLISGRYNPDREATWGPGGRAPLLYDNCKTGSGHSIRIGGSGSGKTESLKSSLKYTWKGPVVVLDPKQKLGSELKEYRERLGHKVIIMDPEDALATGTNALSHLNPKSPLIDARIDDVVEWACGETPEHGGGDNSKFFTGAAKDIVRCLTSHIVIDPQIDPALKTLRSVRSFICQPEKEFTKRLFTIQNTSPSQRAKELASFACGESNDTLHGIHYTAQRITAWLSTECWAGLVCGSGFQGNDITDGQTDLFIAIPFQSLQSEPAVARCLLGMIFNAAFQNVNRPPILFALDEVIELRHFGPLQTAWTMGREFKICMHLLYQAMGQIPKQWGVGGKSVVRNGANWISYSSIKDLEDAKELADTIGDFPVIALSESTNTGTQGRAM